MDAILDQFNAAKKKYDKNIDACDDILLTVIACLEKMSTATSEVWPGPAGKEYLIFSSGGNQSRPFLKNQFIKTPMEFQKHWKGLLESADRDGKKFDLPAEQVSKILYITVVTFCVCIDIWKPKSRKTPGTFFEIVLGTLISRILPTSVIRTKHISLPPNIVRDVSRVLGQSAEDILNLVDMPYDEIGIDGERTALTSDSVDNRKALDDEENEQGDMQKVSTDIVFDLNGKGIVIPAKITTRERIVQPFAHQRILDGVFGEGRYISLLVCVSETQRSDEGRRVNDICVPGTITLFQKHLAKMGGIYYLDPPERYMALGRAGIVPIHPLGKLLTSGLSEIVKQLNSTPFVP